MIKSSRLEKEEKIENNIIKDIKVFLIQKRKQLTPQLKT